MEKLIGHFEKEIDVYKELLSVLEAEKTAIVQCRMEELRKTSEKKVVIYRDLRYMETDRSGLLHDYGIERVETDMKIRLSELASDGKSGGARWNACFSELSDLVARVSFANRRNAVLLESSLALVRDSIELLNHLTAANPVYRRTGLCEDEKQSGRVLSNRV